MTIEHKSAKDAGAPGIISTDEDQGIVEALVSVTGIPDNDNDIIEPGAYAKTLAKRRPKGVWAHDWNTPVSKALDVEEWMPGDSRLPATLPSGEQWPAEAGALWVKAQFNLGTAAGKDAFANVRFFGDDGEWSIGYQVPRGKSTQEKVDTPNGSRSIRRIKEIDLYEYSPVLFGAASNARTFASSIKSLFATDEARNEFIKAFGEDDDAEEVELAEAAIAEGDVVENAQKDLANEEEKPEEKEIRTVPVSVEMTPELVEELKSLAAAIESVLSKAVKPVEEESAFVPDELTVEEALNALVASTVNVDDVENISRVSKNFTSVIENKSAAKEDANSAAVSALDALAEALSEAKNESEERALKNLTHAIGKELRAFDENGEELIIEPTHETKTTRISSEELKSLREFAEQI